MDIEEIKEANEGRYGKKYIAKLVSEIEGAEFGSDVEVKSWISTGNFALNKAISGDYNKGLPLGRVVDIFGDPSTGKSLIIYHLLANIQKMGGIAILDDTEDAYTKEFGQTIGINNEELIKLSSLTVEEHFEKVFLGWKNSKGKNQSSLINMILDREPNCPVVVALDSLALLSTKHEQEVLFEKPDMIKAKQIRAGLRMCSKIMRQANVLHIISNHVTAKIGVMYGPKKTTPGGSGVPFQASVRLDLSLGSKLKDDNDNIIGVESEVYVVKNKVSAPFKKAIVDIKFDKGMIPESGLLDSLVCNGIIKEDEEKKGFFVYSNESFRKGKFDEFLVAHPEILNADKTHSNPL